MDLKTARRRQCNRGCTNRPTRALDKDAFTRLRPGTVHFASQQDLVGLPIYSGVTYRVATKDKTLTATLIGGNFGRLAVHPDLMQYLDFSFQKLWTALAQQKKQLADMQTIVVQKGTVSLVTKGGAAP